MGWGSTPLLSAIIEIKMYGLYYKNGNSLIVADKSEKLIKQLRLVLKSKILTDVVEIPEGVYIRDGNRYGFANIIKRTELTPYEAEPAHLIEIKNYADYCTWALDRVQRAVNALTNQFEAAYTEPTLGLYPNDDGIFDEYFSSVDAAVLEFSKQVHYILFWEKTPADADVCIMGLKDKLFDDKFMEQLQINFFTNINVSKYHVV